jgi:hypothetical protein
VTARTVVAKAVVVVTLSACAGVALTRTAGAAHRPGPTASSTARGQPQKGGDKKAEPIYPAMGSGHYVKSVRDEGRFVTLEDSSLWEIAPTDRYLTAEWEVQAGIAVRHSDGYQLLIHSGVNDLNSHQRTRATTMVRSSRRLPPAKRCTAR